LVRAGRASAPCLACGSMASPGTSRRTMLASSRYSELPSTQVLERSSLFALRGPCARTRRLTLQVASRPEAQSACWAAAWIVLIAVTGQAIYHMPRECTSAGHLYIATVAGLLACFVIGFCLECLLIWESCQGARRALLRALPVLRRLGARACGRAPRAGCIFEVSKRRRMPLLVTLRLANATCEVAFAGGPGGARRAPSPAVGPRRMPTLSSLSAACLLCRPAAVRPRRARARAGCVAVPRCRRRALHRTAQSPSVPACV